MGGWQFWIDRGDDGTDVIARDPGGALVPLSLARDQPELPALRGLLGVDADSAVPPGRVDAVKMATSRDDPAFRRHAETLVQTLGGAWLLFMTAAGTLEAQPAPSRVSAAAAGMVAAIETARQVGCSNLIGIELGARGARVWRHAGSPSRRDDDSLDIRTVPMESLAQSVHELGPVRDPLLVCYGGQGAAKACALADHLGFDAVLVPPLARMLPALGIGLAQLRLSRRTPLDLILTDDTVALLNRAMADAEAVARCDLERQGVDRLDMRSRRSVTLTASGTDGPLEVAFETLADWRTGTPPHVHFLSVEVAGGGIDLLPTHNDAPAVPLSAGWRAIPHETGAVLLRRG